MHPETQPTIGPTIGDQELALLRWLHENGAASVGEAASGFAAPRSMARTTVMTMMERLRGKGLLARESVEGVFRYRPADPESDLMRRVVGNFVERTLGGSFTPLVAYLAEEAEVSDSDLAELELLVATLQARRGEGDR